MQNFKFIFSTSRSLQDYFLLVDSVSRSVVKFMAAPICVNGDDHLGILKLLLRASPLNGNLLPCEVVDLSGLENERTTLGSIFFISTLFL